MKTDMPHKDLERIMRDNIARDIPYSIHLFYAEYQMILTRDGLTENYSIMSETSFVKRIGEWSKPGKWLIKKGRGKNAIYSKRATHRSNITCAELAAKVKGWLWK